VLVLNLDLVVAFEDFVVFRFAAHFLNRVRNVSGLIVVGVAQFGGPGLYRRGTAEAPPSLTYTRPAKQLGSAIRKIAIARAFNLSAQLLSLAENKRGIQTPQNATEGDAPKAEKLLPPDQHISDR
jgi:hypothetical protein